MISARQRNVALLVACCIFMQNLDGTIVITSAPKIGSSLGVSPIQVSLIITAYLVTCAVLIPLGSWLVGGFGARKVFLTAILVFTVSSLLCALSVNLEMLVAMRILQGAGAALMIPTGRIVALANIEKREMLRIISFIVWPGLIAPVIAPLAGGVITTYESWRWIFLINIPLGVVAFLIGLRLMPHTTAPTRRPFDTTGFALTAIGLGGITYTAHLLTLSTPPGVSITFGAVSVACIVLAVRHLLRTPTPLLELALYSIRTFRAANSGITVLTLVVGAVPFILPLLFQTVFGWSAIKSGAFVIWLFVGNIAIKPVTGYLIRTFGFRRVLTATLISVAGSVVLLGLFDKTTPEIVIIVVLTFGGCARSMGYTGYISLTFSDVPEPRMRDANVLSSTIQQLASGLAVASGAVALHVGSALSRAVVKAPTAIDGYVAAFYLLAIVALIGAASTLRLPTDAGDAVRGSAEPTTLTSERPLVRPVPSDAEIRSPRFRRQRRGGPEARG